MAEASQRAAEETSVLNARNESVRQALLTEDIELLDGMITRLEAQASSTEATASADRDFSEAVLPALRSRLMRLVFVQAMADMQNFLELQAAGTPQYLMSPSWEEARSGLLKIEELFGLGVLTGNRELDYRRTYEAGVVAFFMPQFVENEKADEKPVPLETRIADSEVQKQIAAKLSQAAEYWREALRLKPHDRDALAALEILEDSQSAAGAGNGGNGIANVNQLAKILGDMRFPQDRFTAKDVPGAM
jgi:hypothetical protein